MAWLTHYHLLPDVVQGGTMMVPDSGLLHVSSAHSVLETMGRLERIVLSKGLRIMARIDHSGDAAKVGLIMPPAELLIFGNPVSGTPLMVASPTLAIDLPLKALAWQDVEGRVWLSYNSPSSLQERHNIPGDLLKNIAGISYICEEAARWQRQTHPSWRSGPDRSDSPTQRF